MTRVQNLFKQVRLGLTIFVLLFVIFQMPIGAVVGSALIFFNLNNLTKELKYFNNTKILSLVLLIFSAVAIFGYGISSTPDIVSLIQDAKNDSSIVLKPLTTFNYISIAIQTSLVLVTNTLFMVLVYLLAKNYERYAKENNISCKDEFAKVLKTFLLVGIGNAIGGVLSNATIVSSFNAYNELVLAGGVNAEGALAAYEEANLHFTTVYALPSLLILAIEILYLIKLFRITGLNNILVKESPNLEEVNETTIQKDAYSVDSKEYEVKEDNWENDFK